MPIYEYQCRECGHRLDKLQKISAPPLRDCPACEKPALRKLVSAAGFRLKGSGWYETDFKTGERKNLARGEKSDNGKDGGKAGDGKKTAAGKVGEAKTEGARSTARTAAAD